MKCLIVDEMHERLLHDLKRPGLTIDYRPDILKEEVYEHIEGYHILVVRSKLKIGPELLKKAKSLKIIARAGAGIENIDVASFHDREIEIINAPEGNRSAVGEHCLGMVLNIMNKLNSADASVRSLRWERERFRGHEIDGKSIGIIGFGNMGQALAKKLQGFDTQILAYDKYRSGFGGGQIKESTLQEVFEESHILSFHVPLTEETSAMCSLKFIESFRNSIILINTSRGQVVPLKTVADGLKSGKIVGAGLDVYEFEPLQLMDKETKKYFEAIKKHENVIMTPHIAGWTYESYEKISKILAEKILTRL